MLRGTHASLEYHQLLKQAKRLAVDGDPLKLAILADVSTQHMIPLLRVLFAREQLRVEIYEAGYDTVLLESLNASSDLYAFAPQVVVILQSTFKLRGSFPDARAEKATFAARKGAEIEAVWEAIQARLSVPVIQSTFVVPYERPFGHYGLKAAETFQSAVMELNRELVQRAKRFASVFLCDLDYLAAWRGRSSFLDEKLWILAKSLCALERLPDVAQSLVDITIAGLGRSAKCVVVDLDNTLWGGVVGDDGIEGLALGELDEGGVFRGFQLFLRELVQRGILLAVCSKNDEALARRVFREHPGMVLKEADVAAWAVNWDSKAANIVAIREKLHIGYDAMVFLDDHPFERNLVRQMLPQVIVPELPEDPALYVRTLSELNLFEAGSQSGLDTQRTQLYHDQDRREQEAKNFKDVQAYLQSLQTVATVDAFHAGNLGRVAQLIQRSNQFNLTTARYSEAQCDAMGRDLKNYYPLTVSVQDRFGDFGLVCVVILHRLERTLEIDTFLMSCRVLQRGVEQFVMNKIVDYARRGGYEQILGRYRPTAKNVRVKDFFRQFGFGQSAILGDGETHWVLDPAAYTPVPVWIDERAPAPAHDAISA
ncbi:MAG: HAD-IIIC family phosphatase [Verrucomicrobiota bacterium]